MRQTQRHFSTNVGKGQLSEKKNRKFTGHGLFHCNFKFNLYFKRKCTIL